MYFKFYEFGTEGLAGKLSRQYCFAGIAHARCVGQQLYARPAHVGKHVVGRICHIDAFHSHSNHLCARSGDGVGHFVVRPEFSGSDKQTRAEGASAYDEFVHLVVLIGFIGGG